MEIDELDLEKYIPDIKLVKWYKREGSVVRKIKL